LKDILSKGSFDEVKCAAFQKLGIWGCKFMHIAHVVYILFFVTTYSTFSLWDDGTWSLIYLVYYCKEELMSL
jgi:hypothetical protein